MKPFPLWLALAALLLSPSCRKAPPAETPETSAATSSEPLVLREPFDPEAGGITATPSSGADGDAIVLTFPNPMVPADKLGAATVPPVTIEPPLPLLCEWKSPHVCLISAQAWNQAAVSRVVRLRKGLVDLKGEPVDTTGWGVEFKSEAFELAEVHFMKRGELVAPSPQLALDASPLVHLTFTRDVAPAEIAARIHFMDSESHERFPVRVAVEQQQPETPQGLVFITPESPLPPDRGYWLVIDRLKEAYDAQMLPHLRVYPAGRTKGMKATWARAHNQPRRGTFIRVGFTKPLDPASLDPGMIRIDPKVEITALEIEEDTALVFAPLETGTSYAVGIDAGFRSLDGSTGEARAEPIRTVVPERRPAVILHDPQLSFLENKEIRIDTALCRVKSARWSIARLDPPQFVTASARLREFAEFERDEESKPILDPRDGTVRYKATSPLIPSLGLTEVMGAALPAASGDAETPAPIVIPPGRLPAGNYLLEIDARDAKGRSCGNRCLITISNLGVRTLRDSERFHVEVCDLSTGALVPDVPVAAVDSEGQAESLGSTDANGRVTADAGTANLVTGSGDKQVTHHLGPMTRAGYVPEGGWGPDSRGILVTDGDIYRPGETVRITGVLRKIADDGSLILPEAEPRELIINSEIPGFESVSIPVELDDEGRFACEWSIPPNALTGPYFCSLAEDFLGASFTVTEFRLPDFTVAIHAPPSTGLTAAAEISSKYFHGTPHAGAKVRWTAEWVVRDWINLDEDEESPWTYYAFRDSFSPEAAGNGIEGILGSLRAKAGFNGYFPVHAAPVSATLRGDGVLDEEGRLKVKTECPVAPATDDHRACVYWSAEVISEAGASSRLEQMQKVQFKDKVLAARFSWEGEEPELVLAAIGIDDKPAAPLDVKVTVFKREVAVAKELVGRHLVRFRNTPGFTPAGEVALSAPGKRTLRFPGPGDYVVVCDPGDKANRVSLEYLGYRGEASSAVIDDLHLDLVPDPGPAKVGESASIQVRGPFGGTAIVTMETDRILRTLPPVAIPGDGARISIPLEKEDFPNVFVRVRLISPDARGGLPAERMGVCELKVDDPERQLAVSITPGGDAPFRPRDTVSGLVRVNASDRPLPGARVVLMALDEALLSIGAWQTPDPLARFHPARTHQVSGSRILDETWYPFARSTLSQFQKGYVIGGGGMYDGGAGAVARENMDPRPLWQTELVTAADGTARYAFDLPDSLTEYRLVAMAVKGDAFGSARSRLLVSQPLRIAPYLPAFVREGDKADFRWGIELDSQNPLEIGEKLTLSGAAIQGDPVTRRSVQPGAMSFSKREVVIPEGSAGQSIEVLIEAGGSDGFADAVKLTIPILPAHIERISMDSGTLAGDEPWPVAAKLGGLPEDAICDLIFSGTSWLPRLATLPPPGESPPTTADLGGAVLCALLRPELDAYLPRPEGSAPQDRSFQDAQRLLDRLRGAMVYAADGTCLPRWPDADLPDETSTAIVAFAVHAGIQSVMQTREADPNFAIPCPDSLLLALKAWRWSVIDPRYRSNEPSPFANLIALLIAAREDDITDNAADVQAQIRGLYGYREELDLEAKALLALANHRLAHPPEGNRPLAVLSAAETETLIREVETGSTGAEFHPQTLGTALRAEAIRFHVLAETGRIGTGIAREELRKRMAPLIASSADPSAQEGMWVMLAIRSAILLDAPPQTARAAADLGGEPSPNGISIGWTRRKARDLRAALPDEVTLPVAATWTLKTRQTSPVTTAESTGNLALAREIRNITEPSRTGEVGSPLQLGDYVLVRYRIEAKQPVHQLRIEESLPAGLELVNPDLPSARASMPFTDEALDSAIGLTYSEKTQARTRLYFEKLDEGTAHYAVLTRVGASGTFAWPAARAEPLYDKRISANDTDRTLHAVAP